MNWEVFMKSGHWLGTVQADSQTEAFENALLAFGQYLRSELVVMTENENRQRSALRVSA